MTADRILTKIIAIIGAVVAGIATHYLSIALGLADTTPGVIVATALAGIALSAIRWTAH